MRGNARTVALRKLIHVLLAVLLLLPFIDPAALGQISPLTYYCIAVFTAALINSIHVKYPFYRDKLLEAFSTARRKAIMDLKNLIATNRIPAGTRLIESVDGFEEAMERLEEAMKGEIRRMERGYETIAGYIGITFGALGILISYVLFEQRTFYGILSLIILDPAAAIVGNLTGRHKLPLSNATLEGALAGFTAFTTALVILGLKPVQAVILAAVASLVEVYGIEDNLTLPVIVAATAMFLGV